MQRLLWWEPVQTRALFSIQPPQLRSTEQIYLAPGLKSYQQHQGETPLISAVRWKRRCCALLPTSGGFCFITRKNRRFIVGVSVSLTLRCPTSHSHNSRSACSPWSLHHSTYLTWDFCPFTIHFRANLKQTCTGGRRRKIYFARMIFFGRIHFSPLRRR